MSRDENAGVCPRFCRGIFAPKNGSKYVSGKVKTMKIKRNIYLMYAISFLMGMVFYAPVASMYRQARGLGLGQIALIESVSFILSLCMELPWGLIADRIGYRWTMIASCGVLLASKLVFWRAHGFGMFLLERFLLSVSIAGSSGVSDSILYLSCEEKDSQKVFGWYSAFGTIGLVLCTGLFSLYMSEDYDLAALATVGSHVLAALLTLGLREVRPPERECRDQLRDFWRILKQTLLDRRFLLLLAAVTLYGETVQTVTVWLNQNQYLRCGMSAQTIGWVYIAVTLASMTGAFSQTVTERLGRLRLAAGTILLAGILCAALAVTRSAALSVGCVMALEASCGLVSPLFSQVWNRQVRTADRATQLSIFAVIGDVISAGGSLVYGQIADRTLSGAFWLGAAACALCGAAVLACRRYFSGGPEG